SVEGTFVPLTATPGPRWWTLAPSRWPGDSVARTLLNAVHSGGVSMRHVTPGGAACALLLALTASAPLASAQTAGKIPITTSSNDARELYLKGRDLQETLRATDARNLYEQAVAKDPNFALAYV